MMIEYQTIGIENLLAVFRRRLAAIINMREPDVHVHPKDNNRIFHSQLNYIIYSLIPHRREQ